MSERVGISPGPWKWNADRWGLVAHGGGYVLAPAEPAVIDCSDDDRRAIAEVPEMLKLIEYIADGGGMKTADNDVSAIGWAKGILARISVGVRAQPKGVGFADPDAYLSSHVPKAEKP